MNDDFHKSFKRTQLFVFGAMAVFGLVGTGLLGFAIWVVVKLLSHFGVV